MAYLEEQRQPTNPLPGRLFRLVGYGLLLLTLFDIANALIPFQTSDPGWRMDTAAGFVERSAIPLIAMMLIFYGNVEFRSRWELNLLSFLSWLSLLAGVFYFLLIPIVLLTTPELSTRNIVRVNAQVDQQISEVQQLQIRLEKAQGPELENFIKRSDISRRTPGITDPQGLKSELLKEGTAAVQNLRTQAESVQQRQRLILLKNSVKWALGSLVLGVLWIRIWQATRWARRLKSRNSRSRYR